MTTRRDPPDIDDLLREDGGEMGDLYRRLPRYEPPRRLDRAVLGEAARAVHSGKPPRRQRWMVGIGSAAGLVLAAGIAWRIGHDAMNQQDAAAIGAQRQAPIIVPVEPVSEPARKHETPKQDAVQEENAAAAPPASMAKSAGELDRNAAKDESKARAQDKLKATAKVAPKPAVRAAPPPAPVAAPPAAPAPQAFPEAGRARTEPASPAAASDQAAGVGGAFAPAEKRAAADKELAQPGSAPLSSSVELRRDMQLAPEDWLSHIQQLLHQGRRQQATESLRLFRRAHPDWTIPDDLRPLLD